MFTVVELNDVINKPAFIADYEWVQQSLLNKQFKQGILFHAEVITRLDYLIEAILASCTDWNLNEGTDLCKIGAEISEVLSYYETFDGACKIKYRIKASLLYEYAGLPALSNAVIDIGDFDDFTTSFFKRKGPFQKLLSYYDDYRVPVSQDKRSLNPIIDSAIREDVYFLYNYEQGIDIQMQDSELSLNVTSLSKNFNIGLNGSETQAFFKVVEKRALLSTISNVEEDLIDTLREINFPSELWPAQVQAINGGLLNSEYDSWGLASPTGTGKTFLTRLLIVDAIRKKQESKILYIVPSRALVYEVSTSLRDALENLDIVVMALNPQLVNLDDSEGDEFDSASVIVLTPEKADLLIRLSLDMMSSITHVIIDEAHHIESGTRGVLLELYLWRIKKLLTHYVRYIFLSAVAPNIHDLTNWIGNNPKSEIVEKRATRMRAGVYKIIGSGRNKEGIIEYSDGTKSRIAANKIQATASKQLIQLAAEIHKNGPILIVTKGKKESEKLAKAMQEYLKKYGPIKKLSDMDLKSDEYNRLDSRLEREMYPTVALRSLISNRIAYHHAGLPPRVRTALEDAIRNGLVDFVFATTTLAEGVNFPFSSVIVQTLALREPPEAGVPVKYNPITVRSFWNIAGRAGRPGFDKEGQVILFEPSLGIDKINAVLSHYLNPNMKDIAPVKSALSESIKELYNSYQSGIITSESLNSIELGDTIPKKLRGTINLLRVGLVHARATQILNSPEEILEGSFANNFLSEEIKQFGKNILIDQSNVLTDFFKSPGAPSEKIVAEIGLSIDTIERLKNFVLQMEDWQIKNLNQLFYGGELNPYQAVFIIGPVAKNIAELEGGKLGGYLSELIVQWLSGIPLMTIKNNLSNNSERLRNGRLEDLISVIYSRIQFLLPWGLFAVDSILEEEAKRRQINYSNEIRSLSYLSDSGVPSFDAQRLVNLDFERVDATRLYRYYRRLGGLGLGVDIVGWLVNAKDDNIYKCLKGLDNRRIDYDIDSLIAKIRNNITDIE